MPLYEFACASCHNRFERLMSFQTAEDGVQCPSCGTSNARRLISTFAAVSRGGSQTAVADAWTAQSSGGGCCGGACGCSH
jgi:putative FmdB family regulatory protein